MAINEQTLNYNTDPKKNYNLNRIINNINANNEKRMVR